jgi:hypothetical protein
MFVVTTHWLLTIGPKHNFTNKTFIADSGEACHLCVSLEVMLNLKRYATDFMNGENESMPSFSKGYYKGIVFQKDGTYMDLTLEHVQNTYNNGEFVFIDKRK